MSIIDRRFTYNLQYTTQNEGHYDLVFGISSHHNIS